MPLWAAVVGGGLWEQEVWEHAERRRLEASLSFLRYSNRLGSALFVVVAGHNEVVQAENVRAVLFVRPEPTPSLWGPLCR